MDGRAVTIASAFTLLTLVTGPNAGANVSSPNRVAAESQAQPEPSQTPPNDDLADATTVDAVPFSVAGTTVGATGEPGEAADACSFADEERGVWYRLAPGLSASLVLDTEGTDESYDTVLSVWTGDSHPLEPVTCNDDEEGGALWSRLTLEPAPGVVYFVKVIGLSGEEGDFILNIRQIAPADQNDDLADAVAIDQLPFERTSPLPALTDEPGETPPSCGSGSPGAWYRYSAVVDERLALYGGAYGGPLEISAWTGSEHPLTEVACASATLQLLPLIVQVVGGSTVYFRIATDEEVPPQSLLRFNVLIAPDPPDNDDPAGAEIVTALPFETDQDTLWATSSPQEASASCATSSAGGVWYRLLVEADGRLAVHTYGTSYEPALSVWRMESGGSLTELACRTRGLYDGRPIALADVAAGDEIFVLADGRWSRGDLLLSMYMVEVPPNDDLAEAIEIASLPYAGAATPHYATSEVDESAASCHHDEDRTGVWYRFAPGQSVRVVLTPATGSLASLTLWTGGPSFPLTEAACAVLPEIPVVADLEAGSTYYIRVGLPWLDPTIPVTGVPFTVTAAPERPANDTRAGAELIASLPFSDQTSLLGAHPDPVDLIGSCEPVVGSTYALWYRLTGADQRVSFSARSDSLLMTTVFEEGDEPPTEVACSRGTFTMNAEAGVSYLIRVASPLGAPAEVSFAAAVALPPVNDNLAQAIDASSLPFTDVQSTLGASDEVDEAESQCNGLPEFGVWYSFTAEADARISIDTYGSVEDFDTVLSVWTGAAQAYPLTPLACNDDDGASLQSRIDLDVGAGDRMYIRAGGLGGSVGTLSLSVRELGRPPANDDLSSAVPISPVDGFRDQRDTLTASTESEEVASACLGDGGSFEDRTVWYSLQTSSPMSVTLATAGSDFDTVLSLWAGGRAHPLQELACNDDVPDVSGRMDSALSFIAEPGAQYFVQAAGFASSGGNLVLRSTAAAESREGVSTIYLNYLLTRRRP